MPASSPGLADREWGWMAMGEGARWCTRWTATSRKCRQRVQSSLIGKQLWWWPFIRAN